MNAESWHIVEARRDDGEAAIFRIRELVPRLELPTIFVVELPYKSVEMSKLPGAAAYRRLAEFEESWVAKACEALRWVFVGVRIEDGSFFLYLYGAGDPNEMVARLAPFDGGLGFYDDHDPEWGEYQTMAELLEQAKTLPMTDDDALRRKTKKAKTKPAKMAKKKLAKPAKKAAAKAKPIAKPKPRRR